MKTATITIDDRQYMIVFNNAVLSAMEEMGIELSKLKDTNKPITQISQMMVLMITQGAKYAKRKGLGDYPDITLEDFNELTDYTDYRTYEKMITDLIVGDRQVDSAPPKKAEAAEAAAPEN